MIGRKIAMAKKTNHTEIGKRLDKLAKHISSESGDGTIIIGPVVYRIGKDGKKEWYFVASFCDKKKQFTGIGIDVGHDREFGEHIKCSLLVAFTQQRPLCVIDTDCEIEAARMSEKLWPGEMVSKIRAQVEKELSQDE